MNAALRHVDAEASPPLLRVSGLTVNFGPVRALTDVDVAIAPGELVALASLMVVEAQALGATVRDDRVSQSTDAIAGLGRQAMTEMHTTLRLLRGNGDTPELMPQPGLAQLERLLEQLRRAGLEIELTIKGQPRRLAQSLDLSAFRIIQEALTNVVKHAAGATTKVTLAYRAHGIELTVTDTDDELRAGLMPGPSDGHGVIGMRERAALFGGTLRTEVIPGGFEVAATLPYEPAAP
jgi:signal transduction histidine kinase